jgi:hypothetical protein
MKFGIHGQRWHLTCLIWCIPVTQMPALHKAHRELNEVPKSFIVQNKKAFDTAYCVHLAQILETF